jgi:single-stranded DNA-binding protein
MGGINRVTSVGVISQYGVEVRDANSGALCASFMMVVSAQGQDGKDHSTLIPCECWGKQAEAVGELEAGQLVLCAGKLRKRHKGEGQWELSVSGFALTPILTPTPMRTGSHEEEWHGKTYPDPYHF